MGCGFNLPFNLYLRIDSSVILFWFSRTLSCILTVDMYGVLPVWGVVCVRSRFKGRGEGGGELPFRYLSVHLSLCLSSVIYLVFSSFPASCGAGPRRPYSEAQLLRGREHQSVPLYRRI